MEEDEAGAKSHPGRLLLKRQQFLPWHRKEAGAGSQESGKEVAQFASSPLPPSGLHGMKHGAEGTDADGVTVRQRWGAPRNGKEPESCHIPA